VSAVTLTLLKNPRVDSFNFGEKLTLTHADMRVV